MYKNRLWNLLYEAIRIEHTVTLLYLSSYYSIKNSNSFPAQILLNTSIEEMAHMLINCNILNAVGTSPIFNNMNYIIYSFN